MNSISHIIVHALTFPLEVEMRRPLELKHFFVTVCLLLLNTIAVAQELPDVYLATDLSIRTDVDRLSTQLPSRSDFPPLPDPPTTDVWYHLSTIAFDFAFGVISDSGVGIEYASNNIFYGIVRKTEWTSPSKVDGGDPFGQMRLMIFYQKNVFRSGISFVGSYYGVDSVMYSDSDVGFILEANSKRTVGHRRFYYMATLLQTASFTDLQSSITVGFPILGGFGTELGTGFSINYEGGSKIGDIVNGSYYMKLLYNGFPNCQFGVEVSNSYQNTRPEAIQFGITASIDTRW